MNLDFQEIFKKGNFLHMIQRNLKKMIMFKIH